MAEREIPILTFATDSRPLAEVALNCMALYVHAPLAENSQATLLPPSVEYVAQKIAELKGTSFEEVAKVTTENARELFGI